MFVCCGRVATVSFVWNVMQVVMVTVVLYLSILTTGHCRSQLVYTTFSVKTEPRRYLGLHVW